MIELVPHKFNKLWLKCRIIKCISVWISKINSRWLITWTMEMLDLHVTNEIF